MTDIRVTGVAPATVHRVHADTVFLSDVTPAGPDDYVATAVLPDGHPYYAAHTAVANRRLDPMLVLEACRQAVIHHAHLYHDVPADTQFLLLKAALRQSAGAFRAVPATGAGELTMVLLSSSPQRTRGRLRSLAPKFALFVGGVEIGRVEFAASLAAPEHYTLLRHRHREGPAPLSDTRPDPDRRGAVPPGAVGRIDGEDVLIADLHRSADGVSARVLVPVRHLGLFDHPLDHVPGTLLLEAARQLATALSPHPAQAVLTALSSTFHTFAELDAPLRLHAPSPGPHLAVTAYQHDVRVASIKLTMEA